MPFDWTDTTVPEQRPVAVYEDEAGNIVIRQKGDEADSVITVTPAFAPLLLDAIRDCINSQRQITSSDRTAAERQRRLRARRRAGIVGPFTQNVQRDPATLATVVRYDSREIANLGPNPGRDVPAKPAKP